MMKKGSWLRSRGVGGVKYRRGGGGSVAGGSGVSKVAGD